jgi:hypothetical protein
MNKYDEINQLAIAFDALQTQPYEAKLRMLDWLKARIESDQRQAMAERESAAREKVKALVSR